MAVSGDPSGEGIFISETSFFRQKIYVIIIITAVLILVVFLLILLILLRNRERLRCIAAKHSSGLLPLVSKEIKEVIDSNRGQATEVGKVIDQGETNKVGRDRNKVLLIDDVVKETDIDSNINKRSPGSNDSSSSDGLGLGNFGWGRWFSLNELQTATVQFSSKNVVGEGGYGIVYRGVLPDGSLVAVKSLRNNKGQAEKEFKVEVEAMGKVRHKNLVGLIGYCAEGAQRFLVYEYIENGNLEQWLHGDVGPISPLSWEIRMKIAVGTARGLAYLHEGLEPKVVHRDVKASNILLDRKWNPKVSDFGLAKLLGSERSHVTTRVMGTFGYVSPDYASTGMLNEGNDVYSFGVLLMELITGRSPIDYSKPQGEMSLVEWFKGMIGSRRGEELVDPLIKVPPPARSLKRLLLVCLRCIDMDASKRPKMGQIAHMLEAEEFPHSAEPRSVRDTAPLHPQAPDNYRVRSLRKEVGNDDEERTRCR
ncbi:putative receptor-like serine/threonine-protein kinase [Dorcoceras hygrometricum]|uniref:non-specific serine/threonine protein kinase n=1 Tax=Dorcoceras hygrometricum TaxID=472368 RepID=A0A2Z7DGC7_9LAMI|nr:putative receptor-like serine/threonine-protein kinase [Dorcoceras hygrometricum]